MPTTALPASANSAAARIRRLVEAEQRFLRRIERHRDQERAEHEARLYEEQLQEEHADDPEFRKWSNNRAINILDFDYLFFHRRHLDSRLRAYLEIIAAKINHVSNDGKDGYFKKLEANVGWKTHISALAWAEHRYTENLVKCGLWSNARNSRRCHKPDLCPLCLWNDVLRVLVEAYGTKSGAFAKAGSWWFITCGFTTNPNNSKCVSRNFELKDLAYVPGNRDYDPFPVALGSPEGFDPWIGYDAAKAHGLVVQDAIDRLYQSQLLDGYRHKLEGAFAVFPGSANRVNLHGHAVANGGETNGQFLAEELFSAMEGGLQKHRQHLDRDYFPDVLVLKINSPSDLERCIRYSEKVIPVDLIVAQALERPEAGSLDGKWNEEFFLKLHEALIWLFTDDIPNIFTNFRFHRHLHNLRRRKAVGNMTFSDRGTCVGREPAWHRTLRRKKAAALRKSRQEMKKRQRESEARETGGQIQPKPSTRTPRRKESRRFSRSIQRRTKQAVVPPTNSAGLPTASRADKSKSPNRSARPPPNWSANQ